MSKSAHGGGGDALRPAPAPSATLRTVRDVPSGPTVTFADPTPSLELNHDTSLLTLFEAILGVPPGRVRDHSAQALVVDEQIRALRVELGLPEPVASPVDAPAASTAAAPADDETDDIVPPPHDSRWPTWRALVTGLATRHKQYVGLAALAATAGSLW